MKRLEEDEEFLLSLSSFVRTLNQESDEGALIVVEGKNDADALSSIGFRGAPLMVSQNGGIIGLGERAGLHRKMILLLDYDQKGRALTKKAIAVLERRSSIDLNYSRKLSAVSRGRIRHIEELGRFRGYLSSFSLDS